MRLATLSSNPVLHFRYGQYSCVSHPAKGARVSAGSTLDLETKVHVHVHAHPEFGLAQISVTDAGRAPPGAQAVDVAHEALHDDLFHATHHEGRGC